MEPCSGQRRLGTGVIQAAIDRGAISRHCIFGRFTLIALRRGVALGGQATRRVPFGGMALESDNGKGIIEVVWL